MKKYILIPLILFVPISGYGAALDDAISAYYKKDYDQAISILNPLAEKGDSRGELWLAHLYTYGDSLKYLDISKGIHWYNEAAKQQNAEALFQTAYILSHANLYANKYIEQKELYENWKSSLKNYQAAADLGHAGAQLMLAHMHYDGYGLPKSDISMAYQWYLIADHRLSKGSSEDRQYINAWLNACKQVLSPEEVSEIQYKANSWEQTHPNAIKKWPIEDCPYQNCSNPYTYDGEVVKLLNRFYATKSHNQLNKLWYFTVFIVIVFVLLLALKIYFKRRKSAN